MAMKMKYFVQIIALAVAGFLVASCQITGKLGTATTHKAYRLGDKTIQTLKVKCPNPGQNEVTLGFLEFDDQGEPWKDPHASPGTPSQLGVVLDALDKEVKKGPVKLIVFIHGWNNSASPENERTKNLRDFKAALQCIPSVKGERLFGVYVGWRGGSYSRTILLDVATREAVAGKVGGAPLLASLEALSAKVRSNRQSRVIAIGHSYGAKILAQITAHSLANRFGTARGKGVRNLGSLMADTVILANTAESGRVPHQLMGMMRDYQLQRINSSNGRRLPMVICLAAKNDYLVKFGIPIVDYVTRAILGYPGKGGATSSFSQGKALTRAMGYAPGIVSHALERDSQIASRSDLDRRYLGSLVGPNVKRGREIPKVLGVPLQAVLFDGRNTNQYSVYNLVSNHGITDVYRGHVPRNNTPFWVVQVPPSVIQKHNDFWNPNFIGLVTAIDSMGRKEGRRRPTFAPAKTLIKK